MSNIIKYGFGNVIVIKYKDDIGTANYILGLLDKPLLEDTNRKLSLYVLGIDGLNKILVEGDYLLIETVKNTKKPVVLTEHEFRDYVNRQVYLTEINLAKLVNIREELSTS